MSVCPCDSRCPLAPQRVTALQTNRHHRRRSTRACVCRPLQNGRCPPRAATILKRGSSCRLRRSNSQDLQQGSLEEFKRSGVRATATARLGWSKDMRVKYVDRGDAVRGGYGGRFVDDESRRLCVTPPRLYSVPRNVNCLPHKINYVPRKIKRAPRINCARHGIQRKPCRIYCVPQIMNCVPHRSRSHNKLIVHLVELIAYPSQLIVHIT